MALSTAAGAPPAFFSNSYITRDGFNNGGLTSEPSGNIYVPRLYDMSRADFWSSVGSSDATAEFIDSSFYAGALPATPTFDTIILANINLKNFLLYYDKTLHTTVPGGDYRAGVQDFSGTDFILQVANPITNGYIGLAMYKTQVADQEKHCKFVVCTFKFQPTKGMSTYKTGPIDIQKEVPMGDGSMKTTYVMRSPSAASFYQAQVGFLGVSDADRLNFEALRNSLDSFIFMPEPGNKPEDLFRCKIVPNSYQANYLSLDRSTKIWKIDFKVREVGGF